MAKRDLAAAPNTLIWHFYSTADLSWRWERLKSDRTIIARSSRAYTAYEDCLADAEEHGYRFSPSQSSRPPPGPKFKVPHQAGAPHEPGEPEPDEDPDIDR